MESAGRSFSDPIGLVTNFAYMPALDGWRAISILLVLISHGGLGHIVPGGLGVTVFFFISGFLITSLLINESGNNGNISLKKFYLRRFWRLSPPLIVYIFLSTLFIFVFTGGVNLAEPLSALLYFANYYSLYWHYESLPIGPSPLKIVWSLAIEEHYYIFFAPLVAYVLRTKNQFLVLLLILVLAPLVIRIGVVFTGAGSEFDSSYTYMATEARIDSIAWGAVLAWLCNYVDKKMLNCLLDNKVVVAIALALMLFCLLFRDERFRETIRYTLQGIALIPLIYSSLFGESLRKMSGVLTSKIMIAIGKLSYSIYLYHWLALIIANWIAGSEKLSGQWMVSYYSLAIFISTASYFIIEKPCLVLRKKHGSLVIV